MEQPRAKLPAQPPSPGPIIDQNVPADLMFNAAPRGQSRDFSRPGIAYTFGGMPIGAAGVKQYRMFPSRFAFVLDDERKPVPLPNVTQAVRRSAFEPLQRWHYQFHINPAWGRENGRYPRFSFINKIFRTEQDEMKLNAVGRNIHGVAGQRSAPRFTKVLRNPRQDATPAEFGSYEP